LLAFCGGGNKHLRLRIASSLWGATASEKVVLETARTPVAGIMSSRNTAMTQTEYRPPKNHSTAGKVDGNAAPSKREATLSNSGVTQSKGNTAHSKSDDTQSQENTAHTKSNNAASNSAGQSYVTAEMAKRTDGQARRTDGQTKRTDGQAKKSDGQVKKSDGQAHKSDEHRIGGQAKKTDGQANRIGGPSNRRDGQANRTGGQANRAGGQARSGDAVPRKCSDCASAMLLHMQASPGRIMTTCSRGDKIAAARAEDRRREEESKARREKKACDDKLRKAKKEKKEKFAWKRPPFPNANRSNQPKRIDTSLSVAGVPDELQFLSSTVGPKVACARLSIRIIVVEHYYIQ
jgi:hypothetical protein